MKYIKKYNESVRYEIFTLEEINDILDIFQDIIDEYNLVSWNQLNFTNASYKIGLWDGRLLYIGSVNNRYNIDLTYIKRIVITVFSKNNFFNNTNFEKDFNEFINRLNDMGLLIIKKAKNEIEIKKC